MDFYRVFRAFVVPICFSMDCHVFFFHGELYAVVVQRCDCNDAPSALHVATVFGEILQLRLIESLLDIYPDGASTVACVRLQHVPIKTYSLIDLVSGARLVRESCHDVAGHPDVWACV